MSTFADAPPVDQLAGELVATLCMAGLAYLAKDDVDSATAACEIAGAAYERLVPRLRAEDRTSIDELVAELRLGIVKKRA